MLQVRRYQTRCGSLLRQMDKSKPRVSHSLLRQNRRCHPGFLTPWPLGRYFIYRYPCQMFSWISSVTLRVSERSNALDPPSLTLFRLHLTQDGPSQRGGLCSRMLPGFLAFCMSLCLCASMVPSILQEFNEY